MTRLPHGTLADLSRTAVARCRQSLLLVEQLIEHEHDRASVRVTVAVDVIMLAALMMEDDELNNDQALAVVMGNVMTALDREVTRRRGPKGIREPWTR